MSDFEVKRHPMPNHHRLRNKRAKEKQAKLDEIQRDFYATKNCQGWIGTLWDKTKNFFGDENGSEKVEELIQKGKRGKISPEEVRSAVEEYKDGQEMAVDITADVAAGITAVGAYTASVAAAPFTAGGSIAAGTAAAAAAGAAVKTGIKAGDAAQKGKDYTLKDAGYDAATGAFSGVLAPVTGGAGGAVGKTVAKTMSVTAINEGAKIAAKEATLSAGKSTFKTAATKALLNPTGYKYAGGNAIKRGTAMAAEYATDGALGGAVDNAFRAGLNGENVLEATVTGAVGGLVLAPAIGGGIKAAGKFGSTVINKGAKAIERTGKQISKTPIKISGKAKKYIQAEGVELKHFERIKQERPHLSDEMAVIHAKRLQRVEEGKSPWENGPVDAYEQAVFRKYAQTEDYVKDRIQLMKKISQNDDPHVPVEKRKLSSKELDILKEQFQEGTYYFNDDKSTTFYRLIKEATPLDKEAVVYRGISPRSSDNLRNHSFIENIKEGDVITRSGFTSTAPVYDYAVDRFNPNSLDIGAFSKGYVMRITLPKGTKGLDYRGVDLFDGKQSEFVLPPNSEIKVNKIDHVNQIMECEYKLPDKDNFMPRPEFDKKIKENWQHEIITKKELYKDSKGKWRSSEIEKTTYPNREIVNDIEYIGNHPETSIKKDITTRSDGSTVEVTTEYHEKQGRKITKTIRDSKGKILFKDTIKN
ncbi:hypothetical protein J6Q66_02835 [bacterium]|nr:hypothetical protein [bacterium]